MSDKNLKTRCQILKARFGVVITEEDLKKADAKMFELKDNRLAIAQLIGDPINNEKTYTSVGRSLMTEKTVSRGETMQYPNPIDRDSVQCYWLGRNATIQSCRVEGAMSTMESHLINTDNLQVSLEEYMSSLYDFIPEYQSLIGEAMDKREDYEILKLIKAAADSNLYENCVAGVTYVDWKALMVKIDSYFNPRVVLGTLSNLQNLVEFTFEGEGGNTDVPVFTPATIEANIANGILGSLAGATIRTVRGTVIVKGVSTAIMPANRILVAGQPTEVGYICNREAPWGGKRYIQNTDFLPSTDKENPGIFMSIYGIEDIGIQVANSYKVATFKLGTGS